MRLLKNALVAASAVSFMLAQPLAASETRSSQSLPQSGVQHVAAAERAGAGVADSNELAGAGSGLIIVLVFGGLLALFAAAGLFGNSKSNG